MLWCNRFLWFLYLNYNLDELQVNYNNERSKWVGVMDFQFSLLLFFKLKFTSLHSLSRDFTNPNLPLEQKGRPLQVYFIGFLFSALLPSKFMYWTMYSIRNFKHLWFLVLQPGYGDAGGMYGMQPSGTRRGTEQLYFFVLIWFLFFVVCIWCSVVIC